MPMTGCILLPMTRRSGAIQLDRKGFEPNCLCHFTFTIYPESGRNAFTLARIAGHCSITMNQRYCYPRADAIE
jgi:hypothetical protein